MGSDPESSREAESEYEIDFLKKLTSPAKKSENLYFKSNYNLTKSFKFKKVIFSLIALLVISQF